MNAVYSSIDKYRDFTAVYYSEGKPCMRIQAVVNDMSVLSIHFVNVRPGGINFMHVQNALRDFQDKLSKWIYHFETISEMNRFSLLYGRYIEFSDRESDELF